MGERKRLALHWRIMIGLGLGALVGIVLNLTWGPYTWGALGVGDPAAYRKGRPALRAEAPPADPGPAISWLDGEIGQYSPGRGASGLPRPQNAYTGRVVDWFLRDLFGAPSPDSLQETPASENRDGQPALDWLRTQVASTLETLRNPNASLRALRPLQAPVDASLSREVGWLVAQLEQARLDPGEGRVVSTANSEAGPVAAVPRFVGNLNEFIGKLFIRSLQFIAVPIVLFSLVVGASSLGDLRKLGRIGGKTVGIYITTTAIAISVGLVLATVVRPGSFVPESTRDRVASDYLGEAAQRLGEAQGRRSAWDVLLDVMPKNPFEALARGEMLQVVFFSIILGVGLTMLPRERGGPVIRMFDALNDVVIRLVHAIMLAAPYAVFALLVKVVAELGLDVLRALIAYSLVVIGGLAIMALVVYPLGLRLLAGVGYRRFFRAIAPAQLLAFSSSSSNATLPVTLECAQERLGVSEEVSSFVLPLGATVNMDGTALYQGVATVFIAQMFNLPLPFSDQLMIVLTATLASIGTAGVPGVGLLMLIIVMQAVNMPTAVMTVGVATILGVDRLLDMCRTTVNVTGDLAVCTVVARSEGELASEQDVVARLQGRDMLDDDQSTAESPD
ncbi:MAG: dicarboxylate/amino acid:cation symporter [Phycisphaeraceae bacterium]|nr:dicarboxylate/amino acid:cation symporter [Phycisphaeraceae bacterium]